MKNWPLDKLTAAGLLVGAMTPDAKTSLGRIKGENLFPDHTGMTDFVLQRFGLREGNTALMQSCGCDNPDDAAMVIIELTWEALQLST